MTYTGIIIGYNNTTQSGLILMDASSNPDQPNVPLYGAAMPSSPPFVFDDSPYKKILVTKTYTVNSTSPPTTKTIVIPEFVLVDGKRVPSDPVRVSFEIGPGGNATDVSFI